MDYLPELLNFFGNPNLDRHRLLQGRWDAYRIEWDDPEGWSDSPLELLVSILTEELSRTATDTKPALRALDALLGTAAASISQPEFSNITQRFWHGFQFVAASAAQECGATFRDVSRDDIRHLIEARYGRHPA